jgi:hypothetical protein
LWALLAKLANFPWGSILARLAISTILARVAGLAHRPLRSSHATPTPFTGAASVSVRSRHAILAWSALATIPSRVARLSSVSIVPWHPIPAWSASSSTPARLARDPIPSWLPITAITTVLARYTRLALDARLSVAAWQARSARVAIPASLAIGPVLSIQTRLARQPIGGVIPIHDECVSKKKNYL